MLVRFELSTGSVLIRPEQYSRKTLPRNAVDCLKTHSFREIQACLTHLMPSDSLSTNKTPQLKVLAEFSSMCPMAKLRLARHVLEQGPLARQLLSQRQTLYLVVTAILKKAGYREHTLSLQSRRMIILQHLRPPPDSARA